MEIIEEFSICIKCVDDEFLKNIILEKDEIHNCSQCNESNLAIGFVDLAKLLESVIIENFTIGTYQKYFNKGKGFSEEFQRGILLQEVIDEILGLEVKHGNELVQLLIESESSTDPNDYDDREGNFFTDDENYVELQIDNLNLNGEWYQLIEELKTQRRFFSDNARKLFKFLFEDLDELWAFIPIENKYDKGWFSRKKRDVIETLPISTKIYRARRANSLSESKRYLLNPNQELAPPPTEYAQQGRMNAKGISNFYGAFDIDTCIAEMRPSIGSFIVVGEFVTTRELKILNFEYLENSYGHISYFLPDYQDQSSRRKFLKNFIN
ncbi:RES family NAD+ phosphorylase [Acinetobacter colistiniresistens]|uniref:RES family NAD+ phosphorylase n=1 Tax=Acinetobacter colistiniresistens TaxID=280145 RepID=UPI00211C8EFB|nr:RES family NAD+ phosphorylase [Acinetobacter colistiniresistens]UUM26361.1 RES family NAD+ phosphorylase [Acinetobacter colistiniresistens]